MTAEPHPVEFFVDPQFTSHFRNLQQVFLYINDQCNLACDQCIYKPHVTYHADREVPQEQALGLIRSMRRHGAHKLTILGGEPTLYGRRTNNSLRSVIKFARDEGFSYIRIDTNGLYPLGSYETLGLDLVDEIAFSLDGFNPTTSDLLRGEGSFDKTVKRIRDAVERGQRCSITCCIHRDLVKSDESGLTGVDRVIELGDSLGVQVVNFHDLFKAGVPMDTWTGSHNTTVTEHIDMYHAVKARIDEGRYRAHARLPQAFVTKTEFDENPNYFGFCPVKLGERVMIHSDGVIRICSNLICSSFGTATYSSEAIVWNRTAANEILDHDMDAMTPCTNRSKNMKYGEYVPLCFSFKPDQQEPSWNSLAWDDRRLLPISVKNSRP